MSRQHAITAANKNIDEGLTLESVQNSNLTQNLDKGSYICSRYVQISKLDGNLIVQILMRKILT